jgi:hypothetical protein
MSLILLLTGVFQGDCADRNGPRVEVIYLLSDRIKRIDYLLSNFRQAMYITFKVNVAFIDSVVCPLTHLVVSHL